ncbi:hypothetical protein GQ53DRAFT_661918, partial [Thozetella sp. PMI_491]
PTEMASSVEVTSSVPDSLLGLLGSHTPYSMPLLRRLQFAKLFPGGMRPSARVLLVTPSAPDANQAPGRFAAAYVDMAARPETAIWMYSSAEYPGNDFSESDDELLLALFRHIRSLEADHADTRDAATGLPIAKFGSMAEPVRHRLLHKGVRIDKTEASTDGSGYQVHSKWLFRVNELPPAKELPEGVVWDTVREEDCALIRSRTSINRSTTADGTPIAWCFLGFEGCLSSLHVEEPYRGRGLAKAVSCQIMRDHVKDFANDGWGAADVYILNEQSKGMCRSIGGKEVWETSW